MKNLLSLFGPGMRQVLAASSAGLIMVNTMSIQAFPSSALPQMEAPNSTINFTKEEASWFATVTFIMCIPGAFFGGAVCERLGPRRTLLLLSPVLALSMLMMWMASFEVFQKGKMAEIVLLISRVVQGGTLAMANPVLNLYAYEICAANCRKSITCAMEICASLGLLLSYALGCSIHWSTVAWTLPAVTLLPGIIGLLLSPESPMWLARKGQETEATKIMHQLRSSEEEVTKEMKAIIDFREEKTSCLKGFQSVIKKSNLLAVITASALIIFKELNGITVIVIYVVEIFHLAGVGLSPCWSSIVVGVVRTLCAFAAVFLAHNFRKKPLLYVGNMLLSIANCFLGVFFFLQNGGRDVTWLSWLPLWGLIIHTLGYSGTLGPVSWCMAVEMLPGSVRSVGFGIIHTCYAIFSFTLSKTFISTKELLGLHVIFWFYAATCVCSNLLIIISVPETHGRSLRDIEEYWEGTNKKKQESA